MNEIISEQLGTLYRPVSALLVYVQKQADHKSNFYIEHYDIDQEGRPANAHPLTIQESHKLMESLKFSSTTGKCLIRPRSLFPANLLFADNDVNGLVIWYTRKMQRPLFFTDSLGINSGLANVPALLWKVQGGKLSLYALTSDKRPAVNAKLYKPPFFNIYEDGTVCLGTVDINLDQVTSMEDFIASWESFFFNSRFSHVLSNPIKGNCVLLWKDLVGTGKPFPNKVLVPTKIKLNDIIK